MKAEQRDAIIRLYVSSLSQAASVENQYSKLKELETEFGDFIPDWANVLKAQLRKERLSVSLETLEHYLQSDIIQMGEMPLSQIKAVEKKSILPTETSEDEKAAALRDFTERRVRYCIMTSIAASMFHRSEITLEDYHMLEECFADFYGHQNSLIRKLEPPEPSPPRLPKPRRPYTKRRPEYWDNFVCPSKRKKELTGNPVSEPVISSSDDDR